MNTFRDGSLIHINQNRGKPGTTIHKGTHLFCTDAYRDTVGFHANEGTTEYFVRLVCTEQRITRGDFYVSKRRAVNRLVTVARQNVVAAAYFRGNIKGLRSAVDSAKDDGTFDQWCTHMKNHDYTTANALLE